jgi:CBS domain-containing protein
VIGMLATSSARSCFGLRASLESERKGGEDMLVSEVMTKHPRYCSPGDDLRSVAQTMAGEDIGILPVAQDDKMIGMVTDRDIVVRGVAKNLDPSTAKVGDVMSDKVYYCFDTQTCSEVADNMSAIQVRRLPVVDKDKRLVGIVSLGDLASEGAPAKAKKALEGISQETPRTGTT